MPTSTYCRVFCGANKETIEELVTTGYVEIYGIGTNHSVSKRFVDDLFSLDINFIELKFTDITTIEDEAFRYIKGDSEMIVTFDDTLETIGEYAFAQSNFLYSIILPKSLKAIGVGAFYYCMNLISVLFELDENNKSALTDIGISAFQNDTELTDFCTSEYPSLSHYSYFPEGLKRIGAYAFAHCTKLANKLYLPDTLETVGPYAFGWCNYSEIHLGAGLSRKSGSLHGNNSTTQPQEMTIVSKRQFRYTHVDVTEEYPYTGNKIELPDEFKYCINEDQIMVFYNGRYVPHGSVLSHPIDDTPLYKVEVFLDLPEQVQEGDYLDIFYIPETLQNITDRVENFDSHTPDEYINNENVSPYKYLPANQNGFIIMTPPFYGITNKESTFIFINGRKLDIDSIYDVSTTTMKITKYLQEDDTKKYPIEILAFGDNQLVNTMVYSKDGLSHSFDRQNIIHLESLKSYNSLSILDKMLYNLPVEKLSIIFPIESSSLTETPELGVKLIRDYLRDRIWETYSREGDNAWIVNV